MSYHGTEPCRSGFEVRNEVKDPKTKFFVSLKTCRFGFQSHKQSKITRNKLNVL